MLILAALFVAIATINQIYPSPSRSDRWQKSYDKKIEDAKTRNYLDNIKPSLPK